MTGIDYFGLAAVVVMVASYGLESRGRVFILIFAGACAAAAAYAAMIRSWPFFAAEAVWSLIALRRWLEAGRH